MRWASGLLVAVLCASPARGDDGRLQWPLRPPPAVMRTFDAPVARTGTAATAGWTWPAARPAGVRRGRGDRGLRRELAGRPVVSIAHPGGLRTSYEPVKAAVRVGQRVAAGTVLGELVAGHPGCPAAACLHWGAMWGPAARADYVDPLGLVVTTPDSAQTAPRVSRAGLSAITLVPPRIEYRHREKILAPASERQLDRAVGQDTQSRAQLCNSPAGTGVTGCDL